MKWWNPASVLVEVNRRKMAGVCPTCQHGPHRDGPCDLCGDRCHYPKTLDAELGRFADARAEFGAVVQAQIQEGIRALAQVGVTTACFLQRHGRCTQQPGCGCKCHQRAVLEARDTRVTHAAEKYRRVTTED